jgi:hypothetical protein
LGGAAGQPGEQQHLALYRSYGRQRNEGRRCLLEFLSILAAVGSVRYRMAFHKRVLSAGSLCPANIRLVEGLRTSCHRGGRANDIHCTRPRTSVQRGRVSTGAYVVHSLPARSRYRTPAEQFQHIPPADIYLTLLGCHLQSGTRRICCATLASSGVRHLPKGELHGITSHGKRIKLVAHIRTFWRYCVCGRWHDERLGGR